MFYYNYDLNIITPVLHEIKYSDSDESKEQQHHTFSGNHFMFDYYYHKHGKREYYMDEKSSIPLDILILHAIFCSDKREIIYNFKDTFICHVYDDQITFKHIYYLPIEWSFFIDLMDSSTFEEDIRLILIEIMRIRYSGLLPLHCLAPRKTVYDILNCYFTHYLCCPLEIYLYLQTNFQLKASSSNCFIDVEYKCIDNASPIPLLILPLDTSCDYEISTSFDVKFTMSPTSTIIPFSMPQFPFTFRPKISHVNEEYILININIVSNKILDNSFYIDKLIDGILPVNDLPPPQLTGINFLYDYAHQLFETGIYEEITKIEFCRYVGVNENNYNLTAVVDKLNNIV